MRATESCFLAPSNQARQKMTKSMDQHTDSELYGQLGGSVRVRNEAMALLYDRHAPMLYRYCVRILNNDETARDVTHECFLRLLRISLEKSTIENVPGYLIRTARNQCLNIRRAPRSNSEEFDENQMPREDETVEQRELQNLVTQALDKLPAEYREAILLQMYAGMAYQEIAETLGVSLPVVRNRISRGKLKLRTLLQPYFAGVAE